MIPRSRSQPRPGYTLIELLVSSALGAVLLGGMGSAVYVASQAMDIDQGASAQRASNARAIDQILRDARHATSFSERTSTAITFTVPDRDGDGQPETIRYAWNGTPGDPLTYQLNGATGDALAADVSSLDFSFVTRTMTALVYDGGSTAPTLLFVSGQYADGDGGLGTPTGQEQLRIDLMNGWGYAVTVISHEATQSEFDAALNDVVAVYVSGEINATTLGSKLNATALGIVTESFAHAEQLGFYESGSDFTSNKQEIYLTNTTHYITNQHPAGNLTICSSNQYMKWTTASLAPDAAKLADVDQSLSYPTLLILDQNDILADGNAAAGRRCQLPWGEGGFDTAELNSDGQVIMQRAIEWATGLGDDTESSGVRFESFAESQRDSGTTNININLPVGTAEGDLLIATVVTDGETNASLAAPSGWTLLHREASSDDVSLGVWWKLATASEPANYDFTWSGSQEAFGTIMRFSGQAISNPIHVSNVSTGSSSSPATPDITTSADNCLILRIGGFDDDDITIGDTGMSGHSTIAMNKSGSGFGTASGGAAFTLQATAGSSGTADFTLTGSEQYVTVTLAIAPETN